MNWDKVSFVMSSEYRKRIFLELTENPKTPKRLANNLDLALSHVSGTLTDLKKENIVKCLTPERRKYKLYVLTDEGKDLFSTMKENNILEDNKDV